MTKDLENCTSIADYIALCRLQQKTLEEISAELAESQERHRVNADWKARHHELSLKFTHAAVRISKFETQLRLIAGHCFDALEGNKAATVPSDTGVLDPTPRGILPNSLGTLQAVVVDLLETATALHHGDGSIMAYQVWPKDMQKLIDFVKELG